ncbi:MAG: pentapeptide repeat-containing protein [Clostridiales bacterium]|nr:pentapeptide repeat-containing protein [Clostridiales bacterium]
MRQERTRLRRRREGDDGHGQGEQRREVPHQPDQGLKKASPSGEGNIRYLPCRGAVTRRAGFRRADLRRAGLRRTGLRRTSLRRTSLRRTSLRRAGLSSPRAVWRTPPRWRCRRPAFSARIRRTRSCRPYTCCAPDSCRACTPV